MYRFFLLACSWCALFAVSIGFAQGSRDCVLHHFCSSVIPSSCNRSVLLVWPSHAEKRIQVLIVQNRTEQLAAHNLQQEPCEAKQCFRLYHEPLGETPLLFRIRCQNVSENDNESDSYATGYSWQSRANRWTPRASMAAGILSTGDIILVGGTSVARGPSSEIWSSRDQGSTWEQLAAPRFVPRRHHGLLVSSSTDAIFVFGGHGREQGAYLNDVWMSADRGSTWTEQLQSEQAQTSQSSRWTPRSKFGYAMLPNDTVVIVGGEVGGDLYSNEVWIGSRNCTSWELVHEAPNTPAGFGRRAELGLAIVNSAIVLIGGAIRSSSRRAEVQDDVWQSRDFGTTWTLIGHTGLKCEEQFLTRLVDGSIVILGGALAGSSTGGACRYPRVSTDGGRTWSTGSLPIKSDTRASVLIQAANRELLVLGGRELAPPPLPLKLMLGIEERRSRRRESNRVWHVQYQHQDAGQNQSASSLGPRFAHACVAANNDQVILLGGATFNEDKFALVHDVWLGSSTGNSWAKLHDPIPWAPRHHHRVVSLGSNLVMLCGGMMSRDQFAEGEAFNDVWAGVVRENGVDWLLVRKHAPWQARYAHSLVMIANTCVMLFGGAIRSSSTSASQSDLLDDTWNSCDHGKSWVEERSPSGRPERRKYHGSTTFRAGLLISGGIGFSETLLGDVWLMEASRWDLLTRRARWQARFGHQMVTLTSGVVLVVGGYSGTVMADIWSSVDAVNWQPVHAHEDIKSPPFFFHCAAILVSQQVLITGGVNDDGDVLDNMWKLKADTSRWVGVSMPWGPKQGAAAIGLHDKRVLVIGGRNVEKTYPAFSSQVWRSNFGSSDWELQGNFSSWLTSWPSRRAYPSVAALSQIGALVIGGVLESGNTDYAWQTSDAGSTWQAITFTHAGCSPNRYYAGLIKATHMKYMLVGGIRQSQQVYLNDVCMIDMNKPSITTINPKAQFSARGGFGLAHINGTFLVVGGCSTQIGENDVWRSSDTGATWSLVTSSAFERGLCGLSLVSVQNDTLIAIGGRFENQRTGSVWHSNDLGINWRKVQSAPEFGARVDFSLIVWDSHVLQVLGGNRRDSTVASDSWVSWNLGESWQPVALVPNTSLSTQCAASLVTFNTTGDMSVIFKINTTSTTSAVEELVFYTTRLEEVPLGIDAPCENAMLADARNGTLYVLRYGLQRPALQSQLLVEELQSGSVPLPDIFEPAITPYVYRDRPGFIGCGGRTRSGALASCVFVGQSLRITLCEHCEFEPRFGALLISLTLAHGLASFSMSRVLILLGGTGCTLLGECRLGDEDSLIRSMWISTIDGQVWKHAVRLQHEQIRWGDVYEAGSVHQIPTSDINWVDIATLVLFLKPRPLTRISQVQIVSVAVDLMSQTFVYRAGIPRSFDGSTHLTSAQLPGGRLCIMEVNERTERTSQGLAFMNKLRCSVDGYTWSDVVTQPANEIYHDPVLRVNPSARFGMGVEFVLHSQEIIRAGGPTGGFDAIAIGALPVVLAHGGSQLKLTLKWSPSIRISCANAVKLFCLRDSTPDLLFVKSGKLCNWVIVDIPQAFRSCDRPVVWTEVSLATGLVVKSTPTLVHTEFRITSWTAPTAGESWRIGIATDTIGSFRAVVYVIHSSDTRSAMPPKPITTSTTLLSLGNAWNVSLLIPLSLNATESVFVRVFVTNVGSSSLLRSVAQAGAFDVLCPHGHYKSEGAGACQECPAGSYSTNANRNSFCQQCPAGTHSERGSTMCQECQMGSWSASGRVACSQCPNQGLIRLITLTARSVSQEDCVCPAGYLVVNGSCESCTPTERSFFKCLLPNLTVSLAPIRPGWWRPSDESLLAERCITTSRSCVGGLHSKACAEGHTGTLCMACNQSAGYVRNAWPLRNSYACILCTPGMHAWAIGSWLAAMLGLTLIVVICTSETGAALAWRACLSARAIQVRKSRDYRDPECELSAPLILHSASNCKQTPRTRWGKHAKRQVIHHGPLALRSSVVLVQSVAVAIKFSSMSSTSSLAPDPPSAQLPFSEYALINVLALTPQTNCMFPRLSTPTAELIVSCMGPLALWALLWISSCVQFRRGRRVAHHRARWLAMMAVGLSVTNMQARSLSAFACRYLEALRKSVLISHPDVLCWDSPEYSMLAAFAIVCIILCCVAYPMLVTWMLHRGSRRGPIPGWMNPVSSKFRREYSALEAVELVHRVVLVGMFVLSTRDTERSKLGKQETNVSWRTVAALVVAFFSLCIVYTFSALQPYSSITANRISLLRHCALVLCMLQIAGFKENISSSSEAGVWITSILGCMCIVVAALRPRYIGVVVR